MQWIYRPRRAFTLLELGVVVLVIAIVIGILLPAVGSNLHHRGARPVKDASQLRGVLQGLVVWAQNNRDEYPLPGSLDKDNTTTAKISSAKNHSANILSLLIYNGFIPVDLLVSPAEANEKISTCTNYEFTNPHTAVNPAKALWDPAFTVDFTKAIGGTSYAHLQPSTGRLSRWKNTYDALQPVLANRGPEISGVTYSGSSVTPSEANPDSLTHLIHGSRTKWEGNIGFNDNHVDFMTDYIWSALSPTPVYTSQGGLRKLDVPFFDEPDDASGDNAFLGIFTAAGDAPKDFTAIWD